MIFPGATVFRKTTKSELRLRQAITPVKACSSGGVISLVGSMGECSSGPRSGIGLIPKVHGCDKT